MTVNIMQYIATFYSHFGALRFKKACQAAGMEAAVMPVPRELSSSCGSCVKFDSTADYADYHDPYGEIEQIVRLQGRDYLPVYRAANA
ncbi:MAG: DUF3343 domain-containing protein [Bacillota bacterium]|nr:DUF3343 domain-containing protein [Bacillota bacterium]